MCSCARIGLPAATRPTSGSVSCARLGSGRLNCLPRASFERAQCVRLQPDAARGAADQFDHALAGQRLQMLFGRVGRAEAEFGGDLGAGRRGAGALDGALHQIEDLLLAGGELGAFLHGGPRQTAVGLSSDCIFIQIRHKCKARPPRSSCWAPAARSPAAPPAPATTSATGPAQVGVDALVAAVPALAGRPLETEQVAQLDSKDMDHATWQRLAQRAAHHLARADVAGVVVTHGTDTLEETA